jgi:hypothetical protein
VPSQTNVASFVLRFVQETTKNTNTDPPRMDWHGVIKHVQTNNEQRFTSFADAVAFISRYVRLEDFSPTVNLETGDAAHQDTARYQPSFEESDYAQ